MKRKIKNIIMILVIIILLVCSYFTMSLAGKNSNFNNNQTMNESMRGTPPVMPNNTESSSSNSNESANTPPSTSDSNSSNQNGGTPPEMPRNTSNESNSSSNSNIDLIYYIVFGIESLIISLIIMYLVLSKFNKKTFKETFKEKDKIIIYVLANILLTGGFTFGHGVLTKKIFVPASINNVQTNNNVEASGSTIVDNEKKKLTDTYNSTSSDESAILVQNGGVATITGATITKTGDSTNTENSEFYGINAGILVKEGSSAKISNVKITTNAKGSNAVFATGENAKIEISDSVITTTGESSARGLDATYGGYIKADNVTIKTTGGSCATLATDRGEGTVIANNSSLETNGSGSPVIYSTGNISINKTNGIANGSQMVVIEGKNSATVTNSTLTASGKGNRGNTDNAGIMIYQSMSGDASEGTGTFTAKNSSLKINSNSDYYKIAPMFFITNTDAVINLENTKLSFGSGVLISSKGTSEWGKSGSNGGNLTLNATIQDLKGNIEVDKISTLTMNLVNSTYEGTINNDNSAKEIIIKLDKNSKITLTGDSYITSLEDADGSYSNINFNGYKLYVNGSAIN